MPSQEDYLDGLLREMSEEKEEKTDQKMGNGEDYSPDIDAVSGMSEEEIAKLLSAGAKNGGAFREDSSRESVPEDVSELEDAGDSDLREIQELLKKSDRNETIDTRMEELPQGMGPADRLMEDIESGGAEVATDSKTQKALEKKRQKEERAAAKKAAKEAKKAEKEARRKLKGGNQAQQQGDASIQKDSHEQVEEFDMLLDKDLLDSIVSEAGKVEHGTGRRAEAAVKSKGRSEEVDEAEEELEPEVLTLDLEEAAAYIPEVSDEDREGQQEEEKKEKKGLFSKVVGLLMEEEEESEKENENVQISDENQEIIKALDGEKTGKDKTADSKKKKAKAAKKKKDAKAKKAKSKPKKPPKQKKPKEAEPYIPGSRLTLKKILPILLLGLTVGAVTFLFVNLTVDYTGKQAARTAYEAGDYQGCYLNLYGKKLNENEKAMYGKSESILYITQRYQKYQSTVENGTEAEALDCLLQVIDDYQSLYEYALQWNAVPEIYEVYSELLGILSEKYGLTEAQAKEIAALKSDIEYTRTIYAVIDGKGYEGSIGQGVLQPVNPGVVDPAPVPEVGEQGEGDQGDSQPDELPEESEIEDGNFVDNQG